MATRVVSRVLFSAPGERGQMLVLAAGSLAVMLAFAALAIDVGFFAHTKRDLQNDADAMALAGVRELPRQTEAQDIAQQWATLNNVTSSEITSISFGVTCSGDSVPNTLTVRLQRTQNTFLAQIVGVTSANIKSCATARIGQAEAGGDLLPFGLLYNDPNIAGVCYYNGNTDFWNQPCTIKIPKPDDTWSPGNSGPVRLDDPADAATNVPPGCTGGSGTSEYQENIVDGSACYYAPGDELKPKTGSMANPTCTTITGMLNGDAENEVFSGLEGDVYKVVDTKSPHYGIVPVVTVVGQGSAAEITIIKFVPVYVVGCTQTGNGPNALASVTVIPKKSWIFVEGIDFAGGGGPFSDSDWPLYTIKLVN